MFVDHVTFIKTLQRHQGEFDALLQHVRVLQGAVYWCWKKDPVCLITGTTMAALAKKQGPLMSVKGTNQNNSVHPLRKNINVVTMLMRDVLLYLSYLLCTLDERQWIARLLAQYLGKTLNATSQRLKCPQPIMGWITFFALDALTSKSIS